MTQDRGAISAKMAVALVVAITVTALMAAFLLPVAINEIEGDTSVSINTTNATTDSVNAELDTTVDEVNADTNATITLNTSSQSITNTIDEGSNATYSFTDGDVTVTVDDAGSNYAVATYEYPRDFSFSDGSQSLWSILGLAIVLAVFLAILGMALDATNRL